MPPVAMPASEIVNAEIIGQIFGEFFMSRPFFVRQRCTSDDASADMAAHAQQLVSTDTLMDYLT